jgi:autotransporter translocation and assembly factor TamB
MSEQISNYLTRKSTQLLSKSLKAEITAREIKGNLFTGLAFSDVKIKFSSGDSFYATNVKAEYDLLSIIFRRAKNVKGIKIIKPTIYLSSKLSPKPQTAKSTLPIVFPLLFVNRIDIQGGSVYYNEKPILDSFSIKANLNLRPTGGHCTIDTLSFSLFERNIRVTNLQGNIDLSGKTLLLQKMKIKSVRSSISLDGKVDLEKNEVSLEIKNGQIDLNDFSKQEGQFQINTAISANLIPNKWQLSSIRGNLDYRNLKVKIQNIFVPDGKGVFTFYDTMIKINHVSINHDTNNKQQINFDANLSIKNYSYQGKATFTNFTFPLKNLDIPIDGALDFNGVGIDSLDLNLIGSSKNPEIENISAQASLRKGKFIVQKLRIKDHTSILNLNGYGGIANGLKPFDFNFELSNFSLQLVSKIINKFSINRIPLTGFVNGTGRIYSENNHIAANGNINIKKGQALEIQYQKFNLLFDLTNIAKLSGNVIFSVDSVLWNNYQLTHLNFSLNDSNFSLKTNDWQGDSLITSGQINFNLHNFDCSVDSFDIIGNNNILRSTKQFSIGQKERQFYLRDFSLAIDGGTLAIDFITNATGRPIVNLTCNQIDLEKISSIIQLQTPLTGIINLSVINTAKNADYAISLLAYDLKIPIGLLKKNTQRISNYEQDINLKFIEGSCLLAESNLKINNLKLVHEQDTSKIDGLISIKQNPIRRSPLDLNINFANPGVWIFFFLKNILDVQEGNISGAGKITGTFENPILAGSLNISNAKIFIVSTKTQCEKVNADFVFDKRKIILTNLTGNCGTGKINARGYTELIGFSQVDTVSYTVEFTNALLRPQKEVYAIADGKINIDYKPALKNAQSIPTSIAGNVIIKEALLTYEFAGTAPMTSSKQSINLNLKVTGDRDIWLRNRDVDIELSTDLNIFNDGKNTIYSGELNAIQGSFYYLDHILKLTKGVITFDNISELNPNLDIAAELPKRPIKIQTGQTEQITIILALTGRLKEPVFTFTSDPADLSQEDIISYLTFNVTWQQMTSAESRDMFTNALSEKLLGYFERELTKRLRSFIYLDYLMIESGFLSGTGTKVTVGKYIGRNLYFTYEYNITGTANDVFQVEYYISKSNEIIGERDTDGRYNLKYQYKIRY